MANKAISELPQALNVNNQDLFVLEQSGIAKKLTAETFITEQGIINALAEALDGHGGIQSVTLSSVSGRIRTYLITFTDGSATTFQVLDGTSITSIQKTSTAGLVDTYTVYMSDGTTSFFQVRNGQDGSATWDQINSKAPIITETVTGAIANFPDGADDIPVADLVANIEPKQSGSGDPSPSNIRPISGWTGANVTRAGKNLCSVNTISNIGWATDNASLLAAINSLPAGTYNMSFKSTLTSLDSSSYETAQWMTGFIFTNPNGQFSNQTSASSSHPVGSTQTANKALTITSSQAGKYTHAYVYGAGNNGSGKIGTATLSEIQFELGSTATAYEEYIEPTTVTVDWTTEAGTVYGGTIDVATGLLTVDAMLEVFDELPSGKDGIQSQIDYCSPTTGISTVGDYTRITFGIRSDIQRSNYNLVSSSYSSKMCNMLKHYFSYANESSHWYRNTTLYAYFPSSLVGTTITSVINYLKSIKDTNPLSFWVPLTHPQTYQLTGQQLATLLGTNNVWADTGDVSVTYPADTKLYIEKLTMPTEDDLVANQAITSGKYFMLGNSLYLALANIASGAQITIGTNAQRVSLADALNTINS